MSSEIRFYEGVRGSGIVASITYKQSRVIFDFGAPFNPETQPYDGQVEKRVKAWVRDAVRLGQIPAVDGVFPARDLGEGSGILPYEESGLTTGVIISHLHLDHMSGIGMIHPEIPVYLHKDGYRLQMLLNAIGESVGERGYTPIELYEPFMIGEIKVSAYFSDHPCAGAVGYLIETPDGKFYYSGDVRMHGFHLDRVLEDMAKIEQEKVDVMILETTTLSPSKYEPSMGAKFEPSLDIPPEMMSEKQLLAVVGKDLAQSDRLGIFNIYHRDMDLIQALVDIAARTGREIVFEPKTAYIVMNMLGLHPAVYVPDNEDYADVSLPYLAEVLEKTPRTVTCQEIEANPRGFFLQNSYENILELFDLPSEGAKYYHLYGVPLVRGARDYENMMRVLKLTGVDYASFANLYCFNHAYPNHLLYMADRVRAGTLIGVHSSHPEKLVSPHSRQVLPEKGEVYRLEGGRLKAGR